MRGIVNQVIGQLLAAGQGVSSTQVARGAGISRQAAHKALTRLVEAGALCVTGKARAARYQRAAALAEWVLQVASAGASYRLSARLLLDGVERGLVTLDFNGVAEVSEEFLDEVFVQWAQAHPQATLRAVQVPRAVAPLLDAVLQRATPEPQVCLHCGGARAAEGAPAPG